MPRTETHLDDKDIRQACAYWVRQGCPQASSSGVYLHFSAAMGNDPREVDEFSAVVSMTTPPAEEGER